MIILLPQYVASAAISKKTPLYSQVHPFYSESIDKNLEDLQKTSPEDVIFFYVDFYGSNNGFAAFGGNIGPSALKAFPEKTMAAFTRFTNNTSLINIQFLLIIFILSCKLMIAVFL